MTCVGPTMDVGLMSVGNVICMWYMGYACGTWEQATDTTCTYARNDNLDTICKQARHLQGASAKACRRRLVQASFKDGTRQLSTVLSPTSSFSISHLCPSDIGCRLQGASFLRLDTSVSAL